MRTCKPCMLVLSSTCAHSIQKTEPVHRSHRLAEVRGHALYSHAPCARFSIAFLVFLRHELVVLRVFEPAFQRVRMQKIAQRGAIKMRALPHHTVET